MKAEIFVGIDWGSKSHSLCAVDADGVVVFKDDVAHRGDEVLRAVSRILHLADGQPDRVVVAMEAPHGVMVEALLDRGVTAYSLNPKQLDRFRDRHSSGGAKDDDFDAYVLATSLRTDRALFRQIHVPAPDRLQLTALSRSYDALTDQVVATANQVREQLQRYFPELLQLGDWHDEPWLWDLFEAAPTPAQAQRLRQPTVKRILKAHRIRRYKPLELLQHLRQTPLPVAAGVPDAAATRVRILLPVLRAAHQQRSECSRQMKQLLQELVQEPQSPERTHHDAALLLSLPGIGIHNGAVMLTEAHSALLDRDYQAFRRQAGVAPVSRRTGGRTKHPHVRQRYACNRRLRQATYHWGRVACRYDPRARQHYAELRARGHSHGRAIRGVVDRLIKVLMAVLSNDTPYDPALRGNHQSLAIAS